MALKKPDLYSGKSKGQFYTLAEVSRTIAQVIGISMRQDLLTSAHSLPEGPATGGRIECGDARPGAYVSAR